MNLPPLPAWTRWVAEAPAAFRAGPAPAGPVDVAAVVADLCEALYGEHPGARFLGAFGPSRAEARRLAWVLRGAHLCWHPFLRAAPPSFEALRRFLVQDLAGLAAVVGPERLADQEERREELVRLLLRATGWHLPGESKEKAEDLLRQVDSVERQRVIRVAAARERRAREVREAIRQRAAREAAAKLSRE